MATATKTQNETRAVLANPFKVGESIVIPAGVAFTSTAPTLKGRQKTRRAHKVTLSETIPAHVVPRNSENGAKTMVRPLRIRAKGSGGYFKDIVLTDKIVKLNGKTPTYTEITL